MSKPFLCFLTVFDNVFSSIVSSVLCNVFSSVHCPDVQLYKYSDQQGSGQGKRSAVQEIFSEVQFILVLCNAEKDFVMQISAVQCIAKQFCAVQCN